MNAARIELSAKEKTDTLALGLFRRKSDSRAKKAKTPPSPPEFHGHESPEIKKLLDRLEKSLHFSGRKNEADLLRYYELAGYPNIMLLGLGPTSKFCTETARQAGATLFLTQRRAKIRGVTLDAESLLNPVEAGDRPRFVQAFCEGYLLAGYEFVELKQEKPPRIGPLLLQFTKLDKNAAFSEAVQRATILAEAINFARSLGDRPSNHATPDLIAKTLQKASRDYGLKCTVFNRARLEKEKMGLLVGVGKGSEEEPRFIILEYSGGKKGQPPVALVGKGITFDTGGISLKPALKMEEMKYDMMGAATVAGTMLAVAKLKLPINVVGFIAAAENMPDGRAQKPGDVATSLTGKTVEIINTDAEGRLVLADAIEYAQKYKPQAMIDFATLTGAVVVALGTSATGIMGNSRELIGRMEAASRLTDELVWELPLFEDYEDYLKSSIADIKNSSDLREAGSSLGGTFLKFFVDRKLPWVHCDIAGSGMLRRDKNYIPRNYAAGVMIRLTAQLLSDWQPLGTDKEKD